MSIEPLKRERKFDKKFVTEFDQLRKSVTCSICLEIYKLPVCLPCGHSYCYNCISLSMKTKETCPICQKKATKKNLTVVTSLEEILPLFEKLLSSLDPDTQHDEKLYTMGGFTFPAILSKPIIPITSNACDMIDHNSTTQTTHISHHSTPTITTTTTTTANNDVGVFSTVANESNLIVSSKPPQEEDHVPFSKGTLVNVLPRTWIGMNKLGGVGRVQGYEYNANEKIYYYKVKYVLDGNREQQIAHHFVTRFEELAREDRKKRNRTRMHEVDDPEADENEGDEEEQEENEQVTANNNKSRRLREVSPNLLHNHTTTVSSSNNNKGATKKTLLRTIPPTTATTYNNGDAENKENHTLLQQQLQQACSSSSNSNSKKTKKKMVLLTTCMESTVSAVTYCDQKLAKFLAMFSSSTASSSSGAIAASHDITLETRFTDSITHIIVSTDKQGVVKQRTMKYMLGIAHGVWILSFQYILDCLKAQRLLDERQYEIQYNSKAEREYVPQIARQASVKLLHEYHVYLYGYFPLPGPPRSDLLQLIQACGAVCYPKMEEFLTKIQHLYGDTESSNTAAKMVILYAHSTTPASSSSTTTSAESADPATITLHQELNTLQTQIQAYFPTIPGLFEGSESPKLAVVNTLWLMDSVTNFVIQPYTKYCNKM